MRLIPTNCEASFWNKKRVLVTGHTGFKGTWLTIWLQALGASVWGYSLNPDQSNLLFLQIKPYLDKGLNHFTGDINHAQEFHAVVEQCQPDIVFHLAAQPLVRESYMHPMKTWNTNLIGSLNLLNSLTSIGRRCVVIMITTDKVYENHESTKGYSENDRLGGNDPYSASKACVEIAINSWRKSFCFTNNKYTSDLLIATARAGNVIGGGDWAKDRIVPDAIRALVKGESIGIRNAKAIRPWQHVLEPLSGYILLAEKLHNQGTTLADAFNFGPNVECTRTVEELVQQILINWPGNWHNKIEIQNPLETSILSLNIDKSYNHLNWKPKWSFETAVARTVNWYRKIHCGENTAIECCLDDLDLYINKR